MQTVQQRDANGMLVCPVEPTREVPPPRTLALKVMDGALASPLAASQTPTASWRTSGDPVLIIASEHFCYSVPIYRLLTAVGTALRMCPSCVEHTHPHTGVTPTAVP